MYHLYPENYLRREESRFPSSGDVVAKSELNYLCSSTVVD